MPFPIKTSLTDWFTNLFSRPRGDGWMGPGESPAPLADKQSDITQGRQFQYPVGINMHSRPKQGSDAGVSYSELRSLADNYDLVRLCIETRKDQLAMLPWGFRNKDKDKWANYPQDDARIEELTQFFLYPDKLNDWETWLRALIEDLLVIDAPCLYPRMTRGGSLYSLDLVDGSTVKRIIDATGRTPLPPDPAYQQIMHGMPTVNYTVEELVFKPRNVRTWRLYGFSPVEQIITTVNIALRRQLYQLQYLTSGSVPDSLFAVPETWGPEQIKQFQEWWDLITKTRKSHSGMFIPNGVTPLDTKAKATSFTRDDQVMNEWLARVVCYCFNVSPTQLIASNNRSTAQTQSEQAIDEGLAPLKNWVSNLINMIVVRHFGYTDIEHFFPDMEERNPLVKAQINKLYLDSHVLDPEEVRAELGRAAMTDEQRERVNQFAAPPVKSPFQSQLDQAVDNEQESNTPERKDDPTVKVDLHLGDTLVEVGPTIVKAKLPNGTEVDVPVDVH